MLQKVEPIKLALQVYRRLMKRVMERDGWRCQKCGALENLQAHHMIKAEPSLGFNESWRHQTGPTGLRDQVAFRGVDARMIGCRLLVPEQPAARSPGSGKISRSRCGIPHDGRLEPNLRFYGISRRPASGHHRAESGGASRVPSPSSSNPARSAGRARGDPSHM